jgi:hypothetical protein
MYPTTTAGWLLPVLSRIEAALGNSQGCLDGFALLIDGELFIFVIFIIH